MADINSLDTKISYMLSSMGDELPNTKEGKVSVLNKYVTSFNTNLLNALEARGNPKFNAGKTIKERFIEFRENLLKIKPFHNQEIYNQK